MFVQRRKANMRKRLLAFAMIFSLAFESVSMSLSARAAGGLIITATDAYILRYARCRATA